MNTNKLKFISVPIAVFIIALALALWTTPVHAEGETPDTAPAVVESATAVEESAPSESAPTDSSPAPSDSGEDIAAADSDSTPAPADSDSVTADGGDEDEAITEDSAPAAMDGDGDEGSPTGDNPVPANADSSGETIAPTAADEGADESAPATTDGTDADTPADLDTPLGNEAAEGGSAIDELLPPNEGDMLLDDGMGAETRLLESDLEENVDEAIETDGLDAGETAPPTLVVLDQNGDAVPMTDQQAAEALEDPDPWFIYLGITYNFSTTDCDPGTPGNQACDNPIQAAIDYLSAHNWSPVGGNIYVEAGNYNIAAAINPGPSVNINGASWTTVPTLLQLIGAGSGSTTINGYIYVQNMKSLTLQGFTVNGNYAVPLVKFDNNNGALKLKDLNISNTGLGAGLSVTNHKGTVTLDGVDSSDNGGSGAEIDNTAGLAANISVNNSAFNDNTGNYGLSIDSKGSTTITGVTVINNTNTGARINSKGQTIKQSSFSYNGQSGLSVDNRLLGGNLIVDSTQFSGNDVNGLEAWPYYGNLTFTNIRAADNGYCGVILDTCDWDVVAGRCKNSFTGIVSIKEANIENNAQKQDAGWGLFVRAKGNIALTNIFAGYNGNPGANYSCYGADLRNELGVTGATVTITNANFSSNYGMEGLVVSSRGAITLKDVWADDNGWNGAYLDNEYPGATAGVTVNCSADTTNSFSRNGYAGLKVYSHGAVNLKGIQANENKIGDGIYVSNNNGTATVTIDGVTGTSSYSNSDSGIYVLSKGTISVKNMDAYDNGKYGLYLDNSAGSSTVTVTSTLPGWRNWYSGNNEDGVHVLSSGKITLQKCSISSNNHYGAWLNNASGSGDVSITDVYFNDNAEVAAVTPGEIEAGLKVLSRGAITMISIDAYRNGNSSVQGYGVYLENSTALTPRSVSITKAWFRENRNFGLRVLSAGSITLNNVDAGNNSYGAYLANSSVTTAQAVTISNSRFNGNYFYGLQVLSKGNISLSASEANYSSTEYGASLENSAGTGMVKVVGTASWRRYFGSNETFGLQIITNGAVTLNYLTIDNNRTFGLNIQDGGANKAISISNCYIEWNKEYGANVVAFGNISLVNVDINNNGYSGATLDNSAGTGTVSVSGVSASDYAWWGNNGDYGLNIQSRGAVTLKYLSINNSKGYGAVIDNSTALTPQMVTISNVNFSDNSMSSPGWGLRVYSQGNITLMNVSANNNGVWEDLLALPPVSAVLANGIELDNCLESGGFCQGNGSVTLTNVYVTSNNGFGLDVQSFGSIIMKNVEINNNGGNGATLDNSKGTGMVSIIGPSASDYSWWGNNDGYGLILHSKGSVTLKYLSINGSPWFGAEITNSTALTPQSVTITNVSFNDNSKSISSWGLWVHSRGNIMLTNVSADGNGNWGSVVANGIGLDNCLNSGGICLGSGSITLNNTWAWGNYGYGMDIRSFGEIKLTNSSAGNNHDFGASLLNNYNGSIKGVSIGRSAGYPLSFVGFSNNLGRGLEIQTHGAINLSYVFVNNNGDGTTAALLDNTTSSTPQAVKINKSGFNDNYNGAGLQVNSVGPVTLTYVKANNNNLSGVEINNHTAASAQIVSISNSEFAINQNGLVVKSKGNVNLINVSGYVNDIDGIKIDNRYGTGTITLSGVLNNFKTNGGRGFVAESKGNVTISNVIADDNGMPGLYVDNSSGIGMKVSVTNVNLKRNRGSGLMVYSSGDINLDKITALNNGEGSNGDGAYLVSNNHNITIKYSCFAGNEGSGIDGNPGAGFTVTLISTCYMGNDTNSSGDPNLYKRSGTWIY